MDFSAHFMEWKIWLPISLFGKKGEEAREAPEPQIGRLTRQEFIEDSADAPRPFVQGRRSFDKTEWSTLPTKERQRTNT